MKKLFSLIPIILTVVLVFVLGACGIFSNPEDDASRDTFDISPPSTTDAPLSTDNNTDGGSIFESPVAPGDIPESEFTSIIGQVNTISAEHHISFVIQHDGSLWRLGVASGTVSSTNGIPTTEIVPVKIMDDVIHISSGDNHTHAITSDGSLWGWGSNSFGQVGNGTRSETRIDAPAFIMENARHVSGGATHTLAIRDDGSLWAWGHGFLGSETITDSNTPILVMENVAYSAAGWHVSAAITSDGVLWIWGGHFGGDVGNISGREIRFTTPTRFMDNVVHVSVNANNLYAITADGSLWRAVNDNGTLIPMWVDDNIAYVALNQSYVMAVKTDGSLWTWGYDYGSSGSVDGSALGVGFNAGNIFDRVWQRPIKIMDDVALVAVGSSHTLAIMTNGSLWAWGNNSFSQLGDGTVRGRMNPEPVMGFDQVMFLKLR